jgi:hypothetical protein
MRGNLHFNDMLQTFRMMVKMGLAGERDGRSQRELGSRRGLGR